MKFHNLEAEQAVLGAILSTNSAYFAIPDLLPEHFHFERHGDLFRAIGEGIRNGGAVSPVTLKSQFDPKYLASLLSHSVVDIRNYAALISKLYASRVMYLACQRVVDEGLEAVEAQSVVSEAMMAAGQTSLSTRLKTAKQVAVEIANTLAEDAAVYSTGLTRIDFAMGGGLHSKRVYVIPADSGAGKTILACTISNNLKKNNVSHLFLDLEMGEQETHQRSLAKDSGLDAQAFYDKSKRGDDFWSTLGKAVNEEKECLVYYSDPFLTFERMQQVIFAAVVKHKIKGFVLDYFQLIRGCPKGQNPADFMGEVAQWIASACKKYDLFALVTAQLNRDGEVLGSGGLKRASDQVYNLVRPNEFEPYAYLANDKSRYTKRMSVGNEDNPSLKINETGGYFEQV